MYPTPGGRTLTQRARLTLGALGPITVLGLAVQENLALRGFLVEREASGVRARSEALIDAAAGTDVDARPARLPATVVADPPLAT